MINQTDNQPFTWTWTGPRFKILVVVMTWIIMSIIIGSVKMGSWIIQGLVWIINQIT
jgi:hypothetical protein